MFDYTDEQEAFVLENEVSETEEFFLRSHPTNQWGMLLAEYRATESQFKQSAS